MSNAKPVNVSLASHFMFSMGQSPLNDHDVNVMKKIFILMSLDL